MRLVAREAFGLWLAPGLGKTAAALAAFAHDPRTPVLILTRAIGRHVWARDAAWVLGPEWPVAVVWGGKRYSKAGVHRDGTFTDLGAALSAARIVAALRRRKTIASAGAPQDKARR